MRKVSALKGEGYLISSISVVLLAAPGWKSAMASPPMMACLLTGMAASIAGMAFRWRSHRLEQAGERKNAPSPGAEARAAPMQGDTQC